MTNGRHRVKIGLKAGESDMELNEYQNAANATDQRPGVDEQAIVFPLMGLASEVGSLVNQYKKRVRDGDAHELFTDRASEELGDVLWYVANLASKLGYTLEEVAQLNLTRTSQRWTQSGENPSSRLDAQFSPDEQIPEKFELRFVQAVEETRLRVRVFDGDRQVGDPLSDMSWTNDSYRFHDAFHITYAAKLGWSPVTRSMLGRQRESNPRFREVEDSGRAKVIEEAIAAVAFEYASSERFLEGVEHVDYALLQTIMGMCSRLEVRVRTAREWEQAILESFRVWNRLRELGGGRVRVDLRTRSIVVEELVLGM